MDNTNKKFLEHSRRIEVHFSYGRKPGSVIKLWLTIIAIFEILSHIGASAAGAGYWNVTYERTGRPLGVCDRTCNGGLPRICQYHFTVEQYVTLTRACDLRNSTAKTRVFENSQCIKADGYETSGIITANRMYPGPAIVVCRGDDVVIDVLNKVPGAGITIHWHGIYQKGSPFYDGVPYVTQCPIEEGATFRYQWRADNSGTYFWHAHTGLHHAEGLTGAVVVRAPKDTEPNSDKWDLDLTEHIVFLTDYLHRPAAEVFPGTLVRRPGQLPDNILINGMGQFKNPVTGTTTDVPLARFTVDHGNRYRFRMINSCNMVCPLQLSIQGHRLLVFATDGEDVKPEPVDSITSFSAERYDFIIDASNTVNDYWIQVRALGECANSSLQQLAILHYESASTEMTERPNYEDGILAGVVLNQLNVRCNSMEKPGDVLCVSELESASPVPDRILMLDPDVSLCLPFNFHEYTTEELFESGTYNTFLVNSFELAAMVDNISMALPRSNLLTQSDNIPYSQICSSGHLPEKCAHSTICRCTHLVKIPLDAVVEIILVDEAQIPELSHPFHLHGHHFYIVGEGCAEDHGMESISVEKVIQLDRDQKMLRHLGRPPAKDTYAVPNNGYTIIRFIADNPGMWFFHCHFLFHLEVGMSVVFQVGEFEDFPATPPHFPTCGDFQPAISIPKTKP